MNLYIAHTDKMSGSARLLSDKLGCNHGALTRAPANSLIVWLGVPTEQTAGAAGANKKTIGNLKDIRKFFKDKQTILEELNENKTPITNPKEILIYVFGDEIISVFSQVKKTRRQRLIDRLGQDVVNELITNGDIVNPEEETTSEMNTDLYYSLLSEVQSAIKKIYSEYDMSIYAIKVSYKSDGDFKNSIYYKNILLSPALTRGDILDKAAERIKKIHSNVCLLGNETFTEVLGNKEKLMDVIDKAAATDLIAISRFFDMVNRKCVEEVQ